MNKSNSFSDNNMSAISTYQSGIAQATAHRITSRIVSDYLIRYDLTAMQWFIIGYIYDAGSIGLTMTDLGRVIGTTLPYTTNTINLLESKGIINKKVHETDSRTKIVTVNPSYLEVVQEIEAGLRDELRDNLYGQNHISREELQAYITVLYKINANSR
jgi:DNA-binding MarR family transcriptional regulator